MAFQDSFARPLAKTLLNRFRVNSLSYVRESVPTYDPATGTATSSETTYAKAGAVEMSKNVEGGGVSGSQELNAWICLADIGDQIPTTRDHLVYLGKSWKIISIDPLFSGDQLYACRVTGAHS